MDTDTTEAPPGPPSDGGPRVSRDDVRDLARLRRSRADRKVAGVAGGLARHLDIDPVIPRVLLVVLVFFGGAGILLYAALWLVVPTEGTEEVPVRLDERSRTAVLVVVGALAALALVGDSVGGWGPPWPVVVIGVGVLVVLLARRGGPGGRERGGPGGPDGTVPYPADHPGGYPTDYPSGYPSGYPTATKAAAPRRHGPVLFWYALALTALGAGTLGVLDAAGVDVAPSAYPALALGTCAALLLLGAFWGRAGGLIALGLVALLATAGATAAERVEAGRVEARPTTALGVLERYDLGVGEIDLDLTGVTDPAALDGRTVELELDLAGRIEVRVPDGLDVVVRTSVDAGEARVFGDRLGDGVQQARTDGGPDAPELTIEATTVFGEIEIIREDVVR